MTLLVTGDEQQLIYNNRLTCQFTKKKNTNKRTINEGNVRSISGPDVICYVLARIYRKGFIKG